MTKYKSDNVHNRTITLTGHSEMEIAPDIVIIRLGVQTTGRLISNTGRQRKNKSIYYSDTSTNGNYRHKNFSIFN